MERELGSDLPKILDSHGLPSETDGPLFCDRFDDFLNWRHRHLELELAEVTGGEVGPAIAPMEIELHHKKDGSESLDPTVDREAVEGSLDQFASDAARPPIDAFIEEVSSWPEVRVWAGKSNNLERRRIFFSRRGSYFGAFAWLLPRLQNVRLRLDQADIGTNSRAVPLDRKDPYRLRVILDGQAELKQAIDLARLAYERVAS
jgi:hypothetical protein